MDIIKFENQFKDEIGVDRVTGKIIVDVDPQFYRPAEVDVLLGDAEKANIKLG